MPRPRLAHLLLALGSLIGLWIFSPAVLPAAAHTGFESSTPADGDSVDEPVDEIILRFTGDATPTGEGFVILDPAGVVRAPDDVSSADNRTWILGFDPPLAGGTVGVRWQVAAPDAHPIEGSFSFTVTAPAPSTTTAPDDETDLDDGTETADSTDPTEPSPGTGEADDADEPAAGTDAVPETTTPATAAAPAVDLDAFLGDDSAGDDNRAIEVIAAAVRAVSIIAMLLAVGGTIFLATGGSLDVHDVDEVQTWTGRAALALGVGAVGEAASEVVLRTADDSGTSAADVLRTSFGAAAGLRFVGAALIFIAIATVVRQALQRTGTGSGALHLVGRHPVIVAGAAAAILSYSFDGHTVSEGPRWLHTAASLSHVGAAAAWAGGIAMMLFVIRSRRSRGAAGRGAELAARFSVVATVALVAVSLAGAAMSVLVLDGISNLWSTDWGRLLLAKVALVGVAAAGGAYNHRVMVPTLQRAGDHARLTARFRAVLAGEAAALTAVAILTAVLVRSSAV